MRVNSPSCLRCQRQSVRCDRDDLDSGFDQRDACRPCKSSGFEGDCTYPTRVEEDERDRVMQAGSSASTTDTVGERRRKGDQKHDVPKCAKCRKDKQKCEFLQAYNPGDKCRRCADYNFECSEPTVSKKTRGPAKHPWGEWEWSALHQYEYRSRKLASGDLEYQYRPAESLTVEADTDSMLQIGAMFDDPSSNNIPVQSTSSLFQSTHKVPLQVTAHPYNTASNERQDTSSFGLEPLPHRGSNTITNRVTSRPSLPKRAKPVTLKRKLQNFGDASRNSRYSRFLSFFQGDMARKNTYQFSPLKQNEDIRLLRLLPGHGDDKIICNLISVALPYSGRTNTSSVGEYEALSYFWGTEEPVCPVTILAVAENVESLPLSSVETSVFHVRPNLHDALRQLRRPQEDIYLWVDALCIDMSNDSEKSIQVSRMCEIYYHASNVCIWLGMQATDEQSNMDTFNFMRELLDLTRFEMFLSPSTETARKWYAMGRLMKNRWFSRRWVLQELAYARSATVHCGVEAMQWSDFADAVALFGTRYREIHLLIKSAGDRSVGFDSLGDLRVLGAEVLVEVTNEIFRKSSDGDVVERLSSLERLVSTLQAFGASDPRDTVFALLPLARDGLDMHISSKDTEMELNVPDGRILPDYNKSLHDVFADFIEYCIEKSRSLDIICRHWAPRPRLTMNDRLNHAELPPPEMPSWIPSIDGYAFGAPESALSGRVNGDSLVGSGLRNRPQNYNASAGLAPRVTFGRKVAIPREALIASGHRAVHQASRTEVTLASSSNTPLHSSDGTLSAKGMRLAAVAQLSHRAAGGMVFRESLSMGGLDEEVHAVGNIPDKLWRTLVADRGPDGTNPPSWYRRACLESLARITSNGDLNTSSLVEHPGIPSAMLTFLERVRSVVWNRRFFKSSGHPVQNMESRFGLAPSNAEVGDLICILFGCSVPVILREIESEDNSRYFRFIGEAYVHGMMDGQAIPANNPVYPYEQYETFTLR